MSPEESGQHLLVFKLLPLRVLSRQVTKQVFSIFRHQERQVRSHQLVVLNGNQLTESIGIEKCVNFFGFVNFEMLGYVHGCQLLVLC